MGMLTAVLVHNDDLHKIESNPEAFLKQVLQGANSPREEDFSLCKTMGYYHSSDHVLFLMSGNTMFNLSAYTDFRSMCTTSPKLAEDLIKRAEDELKNAKRWLAEAKQAEKRAK